MFRMTRTPSRPAPRPSSASRQRILSASLQLFNRQGYDATSILDIQRVSRVLRGSLYFHFPSKEALAMEVLDGYFQGVSAFLRRRLDSSRGPALEALFDAFGSVAAQTAREQYRGGCLLGNFGQEMTRASEKARRRVQARFDDLVALVWEFLHRARQRGELRSGTNLDAASRLFVSGFHGALIELKVYKDKRVFDEAMDALKELLSDAR